jgi:PhzF family phenazine biosynthesis protein
MKTYRLYQVDAFTAERFRGNPAGVVPNADGLTDSQMQMIAREMNNSETAFILAPSGPDHQVWVRFFTPTTEVPSCGHATVAAHYVRAMENRLASCTVVHRIGIGILPVEVIQRSSDYTIVMTQGRPEFGDPFGARLRLKIVSALGLRPADLDERCPVQVVSTGHSKVLVGIRDRDLLNRLGPDLSLLTGLSKQIGCNGYFVFTLAKDPGPDVLAHGRMFAPAIGIPEDPVTGNANGPLGAYLVELRLVSAVDGTFSFKAQQGEAIARLGTVEVTVDVKEDRPEKVRVGGRAVVVFKTELEL